MKKSILLIAVALGMLTACNPIKDDGSMDIDNFTAANLLDGATFSQYADEACTEAKADGNWIKYSVPKASSMYIYYLKADGSESKLASGSNTGVFNFIPARGSDPNQTVYFKYINANLEETVASKEFTVEVASELTQEVKLLASDDGKKVWKWNINAPEGRVWGNYGSDGNGDGVDFALNGSGQWWGVTVNDNFEDQAGHTDSGSPQGDESMDATMVIADDGTITCYDASGNVIRSGSYKIKDYDPGYNNHSFYCGVLETDAVLFPWEINGGGKKVTTYYISYLSPSRLVLVYPDTGDWNPESNNGGAWGEGTFWQFYSETDVMGCLTDNNEATWTWYDGEQSWGNGNYGDLVIGGKNSLTGNSWWGVPASSVAEQISGYSYGLDDSEGATMTFTKDGDIKKSSGGTGTFSYDIKNTNDIGGWGLKTWGRFTTTGDGVLFPVRINAGTTTNEFDIVYIDDDYFVLAYPNDGANVSIGNEGSWAEGTFWRFQKVK